MLLGSVFGLLLIFDVSIGQVAKNPASMALIHVALVADSPMPDADGTTQ
jgi:hypothetical protein